MRSTNTRNRKSRLHNSSVTVGPAIVDSSGVRCRVAVSFNSEATATITRVKGFFARKKTAAYLVGGSVRDALAASESNDIDVVVDGDIPETAAELGTALQARVVCLDRSRQVYRLAAIRDGAVGIDLSPLQTSIAADAMKRDFTVDAVFMPLHTLNPEAREAEALDPVRGMEDLRQGIVRATNSDIFINDGVRLLRGVRLVAELGFTIEPSTVKLIQRDASLLGKVAPERIRDELCRILCAPRSANSLRLLDKLGLLTQIFPELEAARNVGQPKEHHWDVFNHSIETVNTLEQVVRAVPASHVVLQQIPWDQSLDTHTQQHVAAGTTRVVLMKLAALLHDIAKPTTKTIDSTGRIRFLRHPSVGAETSRAVMQRLRFSNKEIRAVAVMVKEHLRPGLISQGQAGPSRRALYRFFRDAGEETIDTLLLSFADYLAARGPSLDPKQWAAYSGKISDILANYRTGLDKIAPPKLINGHDLIRIFNLQSGPALGALLTTVTEAQVTGEITNRDDALALIDRILEDAAVAA